MIEAPEAPAKAKSLHRGTAVKDGVPIYSWAEDIEVGALEQAVNLASLPFAIHHVALMPDAHKGFGMPIGGVLFADAVIVPGALGVDIGCGVALLQTSFTVGDLEGKLQGLLDRIAALVPAGNGPVGNRSEPAVLLAGLEEVPAPMLLEDWIAKSLWQLGTLGGGNHFIEVQADADDNVYVMVHSGSRGLGHRICTHFQKVALGLNKRWHSRLSDPELAYLPIGENAAKEYWAAMTYALAWAKTNRESMLAKVDVALDEVGGCATQVMVDVQHNYAAWENHYGKNGIVHRKGAVRAREGDVVLIPGSMGTRSYVAQGLGSRESFSTCQHGAGRAAGRRAFERTLVGGEFEAQMAGILLGGNAANARDELPTAYKDVDRVMALSTDLVRPILTLRPLGVVKG